MKKIKYCLKYKLLIASKNIFYKFCCKILHTIFTLYQHPTNNLWLHQNFKNMVLPELNITVVFDTDFNAEKLDKQQNYFFNYITNFVNIVYLPEKYKANPFKYIKNLSFNFIKINPKQYY